MAVIVFRPMRLSQRIPQKIEWWKRVVVLFDLQVGSLQTTILWKCSNNTNNLFAVPTNFSDEASVSHVEITADFNCSVRLRPQVDKGGCGSIEEMHPFPFEVPTMHLELWKTRSCAKADHVIQRFKLCRISAEQEEHEFMQDLLRVNISLNLRQQHGDIRRPLWIATCLGRTLQGGVSTSRPKVMLVWVHQWW